MAKYLRMLRDGADVTRGKSYEIIAETADSYKIRDDAKDTHTFHKSHEGYLFDVFSETTATILATKRTQLATLTAEIAQLEAQLAEEARLRVGDYARVTDTSSVDEFALDDVVHITDKDSSAYPLYGESPINGTGEWLAEEALTKITPAEARASLIAKIDAHFGGQEAK
jgi:hypothetical protein